MYMYFSNLNEVKMYYTHTTDKLHLNLILINTDINKYN